MSSIGRTLPVAVLALLIAGTAPGLHVARAGPTLSSGEQGADKRASRNSVPEEKGSSGSSSEPLSDKLDRSGGVIHPPRTIDREMTQAPPRVGSKSTPVIPPPGTPGGKPDINPK